MLMALEISTFKVTFNVRCKNEFLSIVYSCDFEVRILRFFHYIKHLTSDHENAAESILHSSPLT